MQEFNNLIFSGKQTQLEPDLEPLPNEAPVAIGESASTSEDTSVLINVLGNDTDEDDDTLSIRSWQLEAENGTVTQESNGQLRYTPFPDFHGEDSFTYAATDGQDDSNEVTVTITVTPVNDSAVAFNDAFPINGTAPSQPDPIREGNGLEWGLGNLLANDIDYDGDSLSVYAIQPGSAGGNVSSGPDGSFIYNIGAQFVQVNTNGTIVWSMPQVGYQGTTAEFQYKVTDGAGSISGWATAKLWENGFLYWYQGPETPPPPPFAAIDDEFAVGDDPITDGVTSNDTGADYAVVVSHPGSGRLTSFDYSGYYGYTPSHEQADTFLQYAIVLANGQLYTTANVTIAAVNMEIFNGQNAVKPVREANETTVGAFTVTNKNDTDGDGVIDKDDNRVRIGVGDTTHGIDETDLMKLRIYRPTDMSEQIRVKMSATYVKIYNNKYKDGGLVGSPTSDLLIGVEAFQIVGETEPQPYIDYWVEAFKESDLLRDNIIKLNYKGAEDRVSATGIWAAKTGFRNQIQNSSGSWEDRASPGASEQHYERHFEDTFSSQGYTLGAPTGSPPRNNQTVNGMEMELKVSPNGIGKEWGIVFDISRSASGRSWSKNRTTGVWSKDPIISGAPWAAGSRDFPAWKDEANDDYHELDESNVPNENDKIYVLDSPGISYNGMINNVNRSEHEMYVNFSEFVRVNVNLVWFFHGKSAAGIANQGTRTSSFVDWHSWVQITGTNETNTVFTRPAGENNKIGLGNIPIPENKL